MTKLGTVYLVGAGPGDPQLITWRGVNVLARADVILYDYLVNPAVLEHAPAAAQRVCLGRHGRQSLWTPEEIYARMVAEAQAGRTVIRLKSGDPMIFGRAAGEIEALTKAGIAFEIVPGLTAAMAAPSYAAVPVTDRQLASAVAFVTGQETAGKPGENLDFAALARFPGTLVVYMGVTTAASWSQQLIAEGMSPTCPVALIRRCSWPDQQVVRCRLQEVGEQLTPYAKFRPPVIAIIGAAAEHRSGWEWFARRPLHGETVVVTRPRPQGASLQLALQELGAQVFVLPAIEILDPDPWDDVDRIIGRLPEFDDVVFSSANGVDRFLNRLLALGQDLRALAGRRLVAMGPGTVEALERFYLNSDLVPCQDYRAESVVERMSSNAKGRHVLLIRANRGREVLAQGLQAAGAAVTSLIAYRSVDCTEFDPEVIEQLGKVARPWVMATSASIARSAAAGLRNVVGPSARWVSISEITSQALRDVGIEPLVEATTATIPGMMEAIVRARDGQVIDRSP